MNIEQISMELINKTNEAYFIQGALNNLEKVQAYQEAQLEWGWSRAAGVFMDDLKVRATGLQKRIIELTAQQEEHYKKLKQETNDQVAMSMGYL